jgi:hypothetical protein
MWASTNTDADCGVHARSAATQRAHAAAATHRIREGSKIFHLDHEAPRSGEAAARNSRLALPSTVLEFNILGHFTGPGRFKMNWKMMFS